MSDINIASAFANMNQAKVQMAVAAKIAKMNASSQAAVADLVEAASQNLQKVVSDPGPGLGSNLDISI